MKKGLIQIGLWNVNEKKLYEYLQSIENDITSGSYYKFSDRAMIHAELFESLELADTNRENYKLKLKIAKGTLKAKIPKSKMGKYNSGHNKFIEDDLETHTVQEDITEYPPPVIHFEKCRNCDGTKKCWCQTASDKPDKCFSCKGDGICQDCNEKGMLECSTSSSSDMITHKPDSWTESKLSKKQMELLKKMRFQYHTILSLMWDFSISLDLWIEKQLVKDKEFLKNY